MRQCRYCERVFPQSLGSGGWYCSKRCRRAAAIRRYRAILRRRRLLRWLSGR
ncbi:MAG: hypothetical protein ACRDY7_16895 [Acidimicrobiia bacterium]